MKLENIYKTTAAFTTTGVNSSVQFDFASNMTNNIKYLVDIVINKNIVINNILSTGTYQSVGTIINTSENINVGIILGNASISLFLPLASTIELKIKQGSLSKYTILPNSISSAPKIPLGYSFGMSTVGTNKKINNMMTVSDENSYNVNKRIPLINGLGLVDGMFTSINKLLSDDEKLSDVEELYSPSGYLHDNNTYPKFAYTDKLILNTGTEQGKDKKINTFIENKSISNNFFIDGDIGKSLSNDRFKLDGLVRASLAKADTSIQGIKVNGTLIVPVSNNVTLNLTNIIKSKKVNSSTEFYSYEATDSDGTAVIKTNTIDIQSKIINKDAKLDHFVTYYNEELNKYDFEDMKNFFKKSELIKENSTKNASDVLLYSSKKIEEILNGKISKLTNPIAITDMFVNVKINAGGQIYETADVKLIDLSKLLDEHYQRSGVRQVVNTSMSTIFFM